MRARFERFMSGRYGQDMNASEANTPGRILIISAEDTGHGHKSITEAICSQLSKIAPDIRVSVVDGFSLGNKLLQTTARLYNPLVVNMPALWGIFYKAGDHVKKLINAHVAKSIRVRLLKRIEEENPDLIVSVHAVFIGSVLNILEHENIDIPVVPFIADLDNVSGLWADTRAKYILCPSLESRQHMRVLGIPAEKLKAVGFPVREEFCEISGAVAPDERIHTKSRASVLFVCGSQGSRKICKMAKAVLEHTDCHISIMAGNNPALKKYLERRLLPSNENRVQIHGFTKDIKKHILEADILVVRASPNVLMEAVNLCKPLIVTGAFRGQEEKNPAFVAKYHLGVACKGCSELPDTVMTLLPENGQRLNEIYAGQKQFRNLKAAQEIAELLAQTCYETHRNNYFSAFDNSTVPKQELFVAFSDLQTNLAKK